MILCAVMDIITDAQLIARIEAFLQETKMSPTRFGRETMADPALLAGLKAGRSLSLKNVGKVIAFMEGWQPESAAA